MTKKATIWHRKKCFFYKFFSSLFPTLDFQKNKLASQHYDNDCKFSSKIDHSINAGLHNVYAMPAAICLFLWITAVSFLFFLHCFYSASTHWTQPAYTPFCLAVFPSILIQ